jgi:superfamily II DNA or RNA helicase
MSSKNKTKLKKPSYIPSQRFLSQKGYGILKDGNKEWIDYFIDFLTVSPKLNPSSPGSTNVKSFPVYRENSKKLYIPRALGFELFGQSTDNSLHTGIDCSENLKFLGNLRQEQMKPVDAFIKASADPSQKGGIISLGCGQGKTVCALYSLCILGKKTLIICHKEFLLNQWKERISQFIPTARIGMIKAQILKTKDCDIVLGSLKSLSMKEYDQQIFQDFGTVIVDECHHISAEVFVQALPKVTAPIFLGLSATLDRKDGLRKVFEWFLGKVVNDIVERSDKQLSIKMVKYFDTDSEYGIERVIWGGKLNTSAMISDICAYEPRVTRIIEEYTQLIRKEPGRKTLVLSGRREHLNMLKNEFIDNGYKSIGYYVGGMKEAELKLSESCDIILATYSMASEGMDIPILNTLILASPIGDIEQAVGRIQRQKAHERVYEPYIIEIWDQYSIFQNQGLRHMKFYKKNGYSFIKDTDASNMNNNSNNSNNCNNCNNNSENKSDQEDESEDESNSDSEEKQKKVGYNKSKSTNKNANYNYKYDFICDD